MLSPAATRITLLTTESSPYDWNFQQVLTDNGMLLALDELVPYAHWITPEGMPKRFDTWFFLAAAPPEQAGAHDGKESTDSIWVSPREALQGGETGRFKLPFPTTRNLIKLGKQSSVKAALDDSRGRKVVTVPPVMIRTGGGRGGARAGEGPQQVIRRQVRTASPPSVWR